MSNNLLQSVFENIFERPFKAREFNDRLEMQKAVYLLQNMGISVGDYRFIWYKHGPYSQRLQNDILSKSTEYVDEKIEFSSDAKREMNLLQEAISKKRVQYDESQWLECLGSIQYIKENLLPSSAKDETILLKLESKKPHLNNKQDNRLALQTVRELEI